MGSILVIIMLMSRLCNPKLLYDMVCHPVDLESSLTHLELRKCNIHKRSDMILWSEDDDMIVKFAKLLVHKWWCRIDGEIWIFIALLEIEEFFGQSLDAVM